jgi:hypothetical protein
MNKIFPFGLIAFKMGIILFVFVPFYLFSSISVQAQGCANPNFAGAVNYPAGTQQTNSVAIGDLNGDGKADMVATYMYNVLVYFNDGNGVFGTPVSYTAGSDPIYVDIHDLNGDRKPDLAIANEGSKNVSVFFNNGMGGFGTATNYTVGSNPYSLKVGDLNGDGTPDLSVVNHGTNNVSVLFNNGSGKFSSPTNYTTGTSPQDIIMKDLNGDGKPDMAVSNEVSNNVSVFFNNGSGNFGAESNYNVGTRPIMMGAADFNGDGKTDLTVANSGSNNLSVLFNNGNGAFGAAVNYAIGSLPQVVTTGDVNGDGKPDLLATNFNNNNLSILLNNGNGSFASPFNLTTGNGPGMVAIGDINGDGKADISVANYTSHTISVFLNTCTAGSYILLPVKLTSLKVDEYNGAVELKWTVAEEQGITRYEVEKSLRGENFQKIGEVNASRKSAYNYIDNSPTQGTNYYRLRIFESDGSFHFSPIVTMRMTSNKASIAIYPNPVNNHQFRLQLINQPQGLFTVQLYNNLGQQVFKKLINHPMGSSFETIVLPVSFGKGMYHAEVRSLERKQVFDIVIE